MASDEERQQELSTSESLEILWGALYGALEADLSGQGWPDGTQAELEHASDKMDAIVAKAERLNRGA